MNIIIKEIQAKTMLSRTKSPSSWFGVMYNFNIYRGCESQCIYCDSRSDCYQIDDFSDVLVKVNAIDIIRKELKNKRVKGVIGTGAMSDPYTRVERKYNLTGKALKVIEEYGFPVNIITKSDLILKDIETLKSINRTYASVAFTLTTTDDKLAAKIEPGAPLPSQRLKAMKLLSEAGIHTGVTMMPILPFIEDNKENINEIIIKASENGAEFIVPGFGMTLRDRQRAYYYKKLDELFPNVRQKYECDFKDKYSCSINNITELKQLFVEKCKEYGISTDMPTYEKSRIGCQLSFFDLI